MKLYSGPIPLYYQLQQHLEERIGGGEFRPGSPLPTESKLCAHYGVSRITVRRALDSLLDLGLISRRRGVGTFVADQSAPARSLTLIGSLDDAFSWGKDIVNRILSRRLVAPPPLVAQALEVPRGARVVCIEAVGCLKGEPFVYSESFLPESIGAFLQEADVLRDVPIPLLLEKKIGQKVTRAKQTVEPALADRTVAGHLGIKPRVPILRVLRTFYTESDQPLGVLLARYHPERYRCTVELLRQPWEEGLARTLTAGGSERRGSHWQEGGPRKV